MSEILLDKKVVSLALVLGLGISACGATHSPVEGRNKAGPKTYTSVISKNSHTTINATVKPSYKRTYPEVAQAEGGVEVFKNYYYVSGRSPEKIAPGESVEVNCVAYGQVYPAPSALGTWYHLVAPKQWAGEYAASNAFYNNGNTNINIPNENVIDPRLKGDLCPGSASEPLSD